MNKRVLMVATVPSMIGQFNMDNIRLLLEMGCQVDVACDFTDTSVWPEQRTKEFKERLSELGIECFQLDFSRNPFKIKRHIDSYRDTKKLIRERQYSFVHTHTPTASAVVRVAAHKLKTKVVYTAHGFHFYKGAPIRNWLIFYPVEKWLSKYTDTLITITQEDFKRASEHFSAKNTVYVPGVGVDTKRFTANPAGREKIRKEMSLSDEQVVLLSVGELNTNKNHEAVIRAIKGLDLVYVIVGKGILGEDLKALAADNNVDLRLTGFRKDVEDFYQAADIYILPSIREGLNVSLMEAMASRLPCLVGRIRGNIDLIDEDKGGFLFNPLDVCEICDVYKEMAGRNKEERRELGEYNLKKIKGFDRQAVEKMMLSVYRKMQRETV